MTTPLRTLNSIEEIVAAFGGPRKFSRWCGFDSPASITNWVADGAIPRGWHYRLHWEAIERGYFIPSAVLDPGWEQFRRDREDADAQEAA